MNTALKTRLAALSSAERAQLRERMQRAPRRGRSVAPETYPLHDMQRVIWTAQSLDPSSCAYNVGFLFELSAPYRADLLRNAVGAVVARHRTLRAVYRVKGTTPCQTILDEVGEVPVEDIDANALDSETLDQYIRAAYERPFDLGRGPVWRLTQFRRSQGDAILLIVGHHMAVDLWSINVIMDDLRIAYESERTGAAARFEPPSAEYSQLVLEQQSWSSSGEEERAWRFWSQQLGDVPAALDLPTDHPRTALPTYRGGSVGFALSAETTTALSELARREGKTVYATLLAAWGLLLQKYSGVRDLVVGTPVSNRSRAFARTVGCAINFLPLRMRLSHEESFLELLARVFQTVLGALEHQDLPFGVLANRLNLPRTHGRTSLAQIGFCLESARLQGHAQGNWQPKATPLTFLGQQEGQFELYLEMAERLGVLHGALRYNSDLFERASATRLAAAFQALIARVVEAPSQPVGTLALPDLANGMRCAHGSGAEPAGDALDSQSLAIRALWKQRCAHRDRTEAAVHGAKKTRATTAMRDGSESE